MGETFDIVHFDNYRFSDGSNDVRDHYAVVALSKKITQGIQGFSNQIYCFVVTSAFQDNCIFHILNKSEYTCFRKTNTKVVLDRVDMQSISDFSSKKQPINTLVKKDRRAVYSKYREIHRNVLNGSLKTISKIVSGTIMRELKKNK